ncbi:MAG: hypothetical protein NZ529_00455 [Cytophagaceae bacterium]|nr:hypothetical protein [Cytophagaceae bacterium]MDW8455235.1 hypothetical protein [Cytophagaceae bacterium]
MITKAYFIDTIHTSIVLILFLIIGSTNTLAQGSWDIGYIPRAYLSPELIGKEVRIDFKTSATDAINDEVNVLAVRKLLSIEDTISLVLSGEKAQFKESWKLYVDHGVLVEQTLEKVGNVEYERAYIREMYLVSIDEATLTLEVMVYKRSGKCKVSITVNIADVKGLLVRI